MESYESYPSKISHIELDSFWLRVGVQLQRCSDERRRAEQRVGVRRQCCYFFFSICLLFDVWRWCQYIVIQIHTISSRFIIFLERKRNFPIQFHWVYQVRGLFFVLINPVTVLSSINRLDSNSRAFHRQFRIEELQS